MKLPASPRRNFRQHLGRLAPNRGNFGVIPGSHAALSRAVDRVGAERAIATLTDRDGGGPTERLDRLLPLAFGSAANFFCEFFLRP